MSTIKRNGNLGQSFEQVTNLMLFSGLFQVISRDHCHLNFFLPGDEGEADAGGGGEEEGGRTTDRLVVLIVNHHSVMTINKRKTCDKFCIHMSSVSICNLNIARGTTDPGYSI